MKNRINNGIFILSLDFELFWGSPEKWDLSEKKECLLNTRNTIPKILSLFEKYDIHATWATVGFLFANNREQLHNYLPLNKPTYSNQNISSYIYLQNVGTDEKNDPFHFAPSLIKKILSTKNQELGSHTLSHYYCEEPGQKPEQFFEDLNKALLIAKDNFDVELKSLVLPRNQINNKYIKIAKEVNFKTVRSNPDVWFWNYKNLKFVPLIRAFDTLFSVSRSLTFDFQSINQSNGITQIPASRFFRPYKSSEKLIQNLKLRRIKKEMLYAAKNNRGYHLWFHPHNFGDYPEMNLFQLEDLLKYYKILNEKYNFSSMNMGEFVI